MTMKIMARPGPARWAALLPFLTLLGASPTFAATVLRTADSFAILASSR